MLSDAPDLPAVALQTTANHEMEPDTGAIVQKGTHKVTPGTTLMSCCLLA
jgi:hypothetical protein